MNNTVNIETHNNNNNNVDVTSPLLITANNHNNNNSNNNTMINNNDISNNTHSKTVSFRATLSATFTLFLAVVGSAILPIPYAFRVSGIALGGAITVLVWAINVREVNKRQNVYLYTHFYVLRRKRQQQ